MYITSILLDTVKLAVQDGMVISNSCRWRFCRQASQFPEVNYNCQFIIASISLLVRWIITANSLLHLLVHAIAISPFQQGPYQILSTSMQCHNWRTLLLIMLPGNTKQLIKHSQMNYYLLCPNYLEAFPFLKSLLSHEWAFYRTFYVLNTDKMWI